MNLFKVRHIAMKPNAISMDILLNLHLSTGKVSDFYVIYQTRETQTCQRVFHHISKH